ncbi:hypothetical protein N7486_006918 [Penicillium sp. IBT 16267x]|nr:hypothetical protein N7486_006918 [Penicillium sp. IBT 16267x]
MHAAFLTGLLCSLAAPALGVVLESLAGGVPSSWSLVQVPSADKTMKLSIALTRENLDKLNSKLYQLATPGHPQYGQWLNKDNIDTYFPVVDDAAVVAWLRAMPRGALLNFAGSVDSINKLLDTNFAYYKKDSSIKLRTTEYSIPDELTKYIEVISPTTYFGNTQGSSVVSPQPRKITRRDSYSLASCEKAITPACLKHMYNVGNYTAHPSAGSRIGFGSFLNQSAQYSDLAKYEALHNLTARNFTVELLHGGVNNQAASFADIDEANLDVQMIVAVADSLPVVEYIAGGIAASLPDADEPENEPYLAFYEYLLNKDDSEIPQVLSISYGDDEQTVPEKYARRVCNAIGLNTLRGISIIHSSGDSGVGSACQAADLVTPQFNPIFPATCPYVTAVGGTSDIMPETAWNGSSGGFSNYFSRAWYQNTTVNNYLDHHINPKTKQYYSNYTNFAGREFPDVAAHSLYPEVTAAAPPLPRPSSPVSSLFALLNDARLKAGKPVLGFLNPFFYSSGYRALNDIVAGSSFGCGGINPQDGESVNGSLVIPYAHWNATRGWDPVTGLGTPDFQKLKTMVLSF